MTTVAEDYATHPHFGHDALLSLTGTVKIKTKMGCALLLLLNVHADIDGCASNPCSSVTGAVGCQDVPGAGAPYTCDCETGRQWNAVQVTCDGEWG